MTIPGMEAARQAYKALQQDSAAEDQYSRKFNRMMEDGNNDGAHPPKRHVTDQQMLRTAASVKDQYPEAWRVAQLENACRTDSDRAELDALLGGKTIKQAKKAADKATDAWAANH